MVVEVIHELATLRFGIRVKWNSCLVDLYVSPHFGGSFVESMSGKVRVIFSKRKISGAF